MSNCWKLQNFGEVLEALYAGCHPKLHVLMYNSSCFLGAASTVVVESFQKNPTKSLETARTPLLRYVNFIYLCCKIA